MSTNGAPSIKAPEALAQLPPHVTTVIEAIEQAGFEAWVVGGFVRDALRGKAPADADLATNALWTEVRDVCAAWGMTIHETGTAHGTVTVISDGQPCEVTTYRTEEGYSDHRHPDHVRFIGTIEEDLARRDFTVNAMAFHPSRGLIDPFDGLHDLVHKTIRCVGDAQKRLDEDALRIVRALRFASQLGFRLAPDTDIAVREAAPLIEDLPGERLDKELTLLLCGTFIRDVLLHYVDVLGIAIPALPPMKDFDQHSRWHCFDVLEHTAHVVASTPAYPLVRWAALFHDSGKPDTFIMDADGVGHMPGHQIASVDHLRQTANRLHFGRRRLHDLELLVRFHDDRPTPDRQGVRTLFGRLNYDGHLFHVMCDLMRGDALGQAEFSHARVATIDRVEELFNHMVEEGACLSPADLPVNGDDLMAIGAPQGPYMGLLLNELFAAVTKEKVPAEHSALIAYARTLMQ